MSRWEDELVDPFLADLSDEDGIDALAEGISEEIVPRASLRDAILAAAKVDGRLDRFAALVAELLDVSEARASSLLDGIARPDAWIDGPVPGVSLYHVQGGPKVAGAATGFARMSGGVVFPEHEHLGDEVVLVVQGSFEDGVTGRVHRPGDVVRMPAGSAHDFRARPGPALVYLIVLQTGVKIGEHVLRADDPRL